MPEFRFTCALEHGLHARPASVLAEAVRPFAARVELVKEASGRAADARSVLSVVALDVARGDACAIRAEGEDADHAIAAARQIIERGFGEATVIEAKEAVPAKVRRIPAGLRQLNVGDHAPHGGPIVLPVVDNRVMYIIAILVGTIVTAMAINVLKKTTRGAKPG